MSISLFVGDQAAADCVTTENRTCNMPLDEVAGWMRRQNENLHHISVHTSIISCTAGFT